MSQAGLSPGEQCRAAILAAERGHGIPPQLLASIGRVESGRRDPASGAWGAWPWTINAEGQGAYFNTRMEAIQAVEALRARGVRSIDVGCMQVNLMHHPNAFTTLDMAFEPAINADYAARFLVQLHDQTGDWNTATADYHSSNPGEGMPYAAKVASVWPEEQHKAGLAPAEALQTGNGAPYMGAATPFPIHQAPRLLAMAGMPPVMMPPRAASPGTQAGFGAQGMMYGQHNYPPGRGLDFYRSIPIRMDMALRSTVHMVNRVAIR